MPKLKECERRQSLVTRKSYRGTGITLIVSGCSIDQQWIMVRDAVKSTAENVLGIQEKQLHKTWYDDECVAATALKNQAYRLIIQRRTIATVNEYRSKRRAEKHVH